MSRHADPGHDLGPWKHQAACLPHAGDLWFSHEGTEDRAAAIAVCHTCPVRIECLAHALEHDERFGIWGGKTERERRTIRRSATRLARKVMR